MQNSPGNLLKNNIDLLLKIIHNSKNIYGSDLDLLVETIKKMQFMRVELTKKENRGQ